MIKIVGKTIATTGASSSSSLGVLVGEAVGASVELVVGEAVGLLVGEAVGASVELVVGEAVGVVVGDPVGDTVGLLVGELVGASVLASDTIILTCIDG